jgi:hypothetical protein
MPPVEPLSTAASRSRVGPLPELPKVGSDRLAHARQTPRRSDLKPHSVACVSEVLTERAFCEAGNADAGTAVTKRIGRSSSAAP